MLSNDFANDILKFVFNKTGISGIGDNLYISLHTADPGADGNQASNEVSYTGYERVTLPRNANWFVINGTVMNPAQTIEFGEMTGGDSQTVVYMCIGMDKTGAGKVLFRFALTPGITTGVGVMPRIRTSTALLAVTA